LCAQEIFFPFPAYTLFPLLFHYITPWVVSASDAGPEQQMPLNITILQENANHNSAGLKKMPCRKKSAGQCPSLTFTLYD
jgi:hypothetical protein